MVLPHHGSQILFRHDEGGFLSEKDGSVIKNFRVEQFLRECFFDWSGHDVRSAKGSHMPELLFTDQFDCFEAKPCCEDAIIGCGRSTSLDVA
jgi:hypothetical protein